MLYRFALFFSPLLRPALSPLCNPPSQKLLFSAYFRLFWFWRLLPRNILLQFILRDKMTIFQPKAIWFNLSILEPNQNKNRKQNVKPKIIQNSACCDYVTSLVPWREKNLTLPERNGPERCERASDSPPRRSAPFRSDSIEKSLGNHHKVVRIWKIIPTEAGLLWRSFRLPGDRWLFSFHAVVVNRDF